MIDTCSGARIAAAEDGSSKTDIGGFGSLFGGTGGGAGGVGLSSYNNTRQGKVITAAFMDACSNIVRSLRQEEAQEVKEDWGGKI